MSAHIIVQNRTGEVQTVGGLVFDKGAAGDEENGETRDLTEDMASGVFADVFVEPLNKTLAASLDDGDLLLVSPPLPRASVPPSSVVQAASLYTVEASTSLVVFRGEVANEAALSTLTSPSELDYAAVADTGTLWVYTGAAAGWVDTTLAATFQNWTPPVGPPPVPENLGQVTLDLSRTANVAIQGATGEIYRTGPTGSGYNIAGIATVETISAPGEYFEFPAVVVNSHQGFALASAADCDGAGPNENNRQPPGVLWTSGTASWSGRSFVGYFTGSGIWTNASQNGSSVGNGSGYSNTLLNEAGLFSTGAQIRIGLDPQYHAYIGVVVDNVVRVIFRSVTPMPVQDYKFVWNGHYIASKLSQLPNVITTPAPAYSDTHYVNFDGADEYVSFSDSGPIANVLRWDEDWSFGFKLGNTWNPPAVDKKDTVLRNGQNAFYIRAANTGNAAPYLQNGPFYDGQNTWQGLSAGDRVVVTYDAANFRAKYYKNGVLVGGGWVLNAGRTRDQNNADGTLTLGKGGGWSSFLAGGLDEVFFVGRTMTPAEAAESAAGGDPAVWSFYAEIIEFLLMGENTFPGIQGVKGVLSGTLENGEAEDFAAY